MEQRRHLIEEGPHRLLWDAHSVSGVVFGLALFVIFFSGAFALYRAELITWADPVLREHDNPRPIDELVSPVLAEHPPVPGADVIVNWPMYERPHALVRYPTADGDGQREVIAIFNPATGERFFSERFSGRSSLSQILYELHFFGPAGLIGESIAGIIAVLCLFAVVSGVLIHLRKLPRDWHTFRPARKLRVALADAHTVLGMIGLPFTVMYAISGAFLGLTLAILAPVVLVLFDGDREALQDLVEGYTAPKVELTEEQAPMLPFEEIARTSEKHWKGAADAVVVVVEGYGDRGALAKVYGAAKGSLTASPSLVMKATDGEILASSDPDRAGVLEGTTAALVNLHYARFGMPLAKTLYFFLALAVGAVILSGNLLWILVRRPAAGAESPRLHRFLARLTVGVGCGLVAAVPILFLTTRALPLDLSSLATLEHVALYGSWSLFILTAFVGPSPVAAARWQLGVAGVGSLAVPVASGLSGAWPWISVTEGWWGILTIDCGFLVMGLGLLWTARSMRSGISAEPTIRVESSELAPAGS
ncbi:MAG: PepSY-associated TM helix domain-containing protein [Myxococcota bacterium]